MTTLSLKQILTRIGATDIKIKNHKINGQNRAENSGFFTMDGQPYYISTTWGGHDYERDYKRACPITDTNGNFNPGANIMFRKCRDYKDYSGGVNMWDFGRFCIGRGIPSDTMINIW